MARPLTLTEHLDSIDYWANRILDGERRHQGTRACPTDDETSASQILAHTAAICSKALRFVGISAGAAGEADTVGRSEK